MIARVWFCIFYCWKTRIFSVTICKASYRITISRDSQRHACTLTCEILSAWARQISSLVQSRHIQEINERLMYLCKYRVSSFLYRVFRNRFWCLFDISECITRKWFHVGSYLRMLIGLGNLYRKLKLKL